MKLTVKHTLGAARVGELDFRRGVVHTPAFMPVGTYGTVKSVTPEEVAAAALVDRAMHATSSLFEDGAVRREAQVEDGLPELTGDPDRLAATEVAGALRGLSQRFL